MTEHAARAHARLSASGADRWLSCPGSARLEDGLPDTTSVFAQWGTTCHELGELALRERLLGERVVYPAGTYEPEMYEVVADYRAHIERLIATHGQGEEPVVLVERRVDFSRWVPEGFGTADCILAFVRQRKVVVVDLKTGKGVKVFAADNPQGMLYAAGTLEYLRLICDFDTIVVAISQPRLNHFDEWEIPVPALEAWLEQTVAPTARLAFAGEGHLASGDHCTFCKAKPTCPQLRDDCMAAFDDGPVAGSLTPDQIAALLPRLDLVQAWAKSVQEYALHQAVTHGVQFPGHKLVAGRTTRRWRDETEVATVLKAEGYKDTDLYECAAPEFLGITAAEKLVGKKHRVFELTVKTEGKPALVPSSDSRPEFNDHRTISANFED